MCMDDIYNLATMISTADHNIKIQQKLNIFLKEANGFLRIANEEKDLVKLKKYMKIILQDLQIFYLNLKILSQVKLVLFEATL